MFQRFLDPEDGQLDLSEWLLDRRGFLPVPIIITEPAVGFGGGVALVFISETFREVADRAKASGHITPPNIFAIGGFATENGTKGALIGGQFTFQDDRWRYRGGIGDFSINLDFYGVGGQLPIPVDKIGYNLKGLGSFQQGMYRLGESSTFIGARWVYVDMASRLDVDADSAGLTPKELAKRSSGLGVVVEHDTRDNIFTPNRGWIGAAEATFYDRAIGSSNNFQAYRAHTFAYWPVMENLTVGMRADYRAARGEVPFYFLPFIDLRGIPAARYQDNNAAVLETEVRYNFTPRWAGIAFIGAGRAWGRSEGFNDAGSAVGKGIGVRYLVARRLGLYAGIDYAKGPEDGVFYIQMGSAWR
jgi:outer membrane protein assembly factor BamA